MSIRKFMVGTIIFACLIFCFSYLIIINNLVIDEKAIISDVIIVPEGGAIHRAEKAEQLLADGYSESGKLIVSPLTKSNIIHYKLVGIDENQIIPETEATSTYENAKNTLSIMKRNNFSSAIIVSSDYHMLRTKLIYERVNKDYDFDLTYVAAYQLVDNEFVTWYEAGPDMHQVANREFWKYLGYLLGLYYLFNL